MFLRHVFGFAAVAAVAASALACGESGRPDASSTRPEAPPAAAIEQPAPGRGAEPPAAASQPGLDGVLQPAPAGTTAQRDDAANVRHSAGLSNGTTASTDEDASRTTGDTIDAAAATTTPFVSIPGNETIVPLATPTRTPTRTPTATATPPPGSAPVIGGCQVFPSNNPWNADVSGYALHANSQNFINQILGTGGTGKLHPDFGSNPTYGIPYVVVPQSQPMTTINFTDYGDESDPSPYPIPLNAPVEGGAGSGGDRHVLALQQGTCKLYELFYAWPQSNRWDASGGAVFDLNSNALRPEGWTSADAAGLPILPGLVRYDEVQSGEITHALRFTVSQTQRGYIHPATHFASSSTDPNRPPMGLRLRLKASYNISAYTGDSRVILEALKKYGMIVADNGSPWFISGGTDARWDDDDLNQLKNVPGSAFEVVNTGAIITP